MFTIPAGKASTCTKQCMETAEQEEEMKKTIAPHSNFIYEASPENRRKEISGSIPEPYRPK